MGNYPISEGVFTQSGPLAELRLVRFTSEKRPINGVKSGSPAGKGAVAGKHKVTVTKFSAPAGVSTVSTMEEMVVAANKPKSASSSDTPANQLPKRYENVETSLLEFEVASSGTNDFKIELTD